MTFSTARRSSSGSPATVTGRRRPVFDLATARGGFDAGIVHQLPHKFVEADGVAAQRSRVALGARHLQELADQRVQPVGFLLDAVERRFGVVAGARQLHGHAQARQRRAQFVRNIEQQAALGGQQSFDALGHAVEGARQICPVRRGAWN